MTRVKRRAIAILFALLGINGGLQAVLALAGRSTDPGLLIVMQAVTGIAGLATAIGAWRGASWAARAALAYGVVTAAMLVSLGPLLGLERRALPGIWIGAALVLVGSVAAARYLRRASQAPGPGLEDAITRP